MMTLDLKKLKFYKGALNFYKATKSEKRGNILFEKLVSTGFLPTLELNFYPSYGYFDDLGEFLSNLMHQINVEDFTFNSFNDNYVYKNSPNYTNKKVLTSGLYTTFRAGYGMPFFCPI